MCGIAGVVNWSDEGAAASGSSVAAARLALGERVGRMADTLRHRGPDDAGVWVDDRARCGLGHRRLSVIDLAGGHQPISNESGSVWAVFNGEIYNFKALRDELQSAGHCFATESDTEVLVHLWEQEGDRLANRLDGMFAFAIWDSRSATLFAATDPLGKKPLYYAAGATTFAFGSELKSLLVDPSLSREVDPEAVQFYLHLGYIPAPWSVLRSIRKLPPGSTLTATAGRLRVARYWSVHKARPAEVHVDDFGAACQRVRQGLTAAVEKRLVADVPLGAFLSGGIDSTIVVGLMSRLMSRPVDTFTISFDEAAFDESKFAAQVADRFGTHHRTLTVRPDAVEALPVLARHFDEPFGDSSALATYYVSKLTREYVTVALTGDGGDEAFGGYRRYRRGKLAGWLRRWPAATGLASATGRLLPARLDRTSDWGRARRVLRGLSGSASSAYLEQMTIFPPGVLARLQTPDLRQASASARVAEWFNSLYANADPGDPAAADMAADLQSYLPGDILTKVDRASMAVALECRSPFLDRQVVELALGLPTRWRLRGLAGHKWILRQAFADLLPPEIANRRKAGFAVPLPAWFRGPLRGVLQDVVLSPGASLGAWVERKEVESLIREHDAGYNHATPLWSLLMLEMWFRTWSHPTAASRG